MVAALQILCNNEPSTYVMRHGERECSVRVETDDGHVVEWRRKHSPSYVIDGQTFDRLRTGGLPDELHKALRLPKVDATAERDFDIHFGTQKSPIFLLGSAANAARFFASSSDAIRLVEMQARHKEKLANANREKNRLEAESKQVNDELEAIKPVVELDHRLGAATGIYDAVVQCAARLDEGRKHEAAIRAQSGVLAEHAAQAEVLRPLHPPPEMHPVEPLEKLLAATVAAIARCEAAGSRAAAIAGLSPPPALDPTERLAGLIAAIELEAGRRKAADARSGSLSAIRPPPELLDAAPLARLTERMADLAAEAARGRAEWQLLSGLSHPPQLADVDTLSRLVGRLEEAAAQRMAAQRRTAALGDVPQPPRPADESELARLLVSVAKASADAARWKGAASALASAGPLPARVETAALSELLDRLDAAAVGVGTCAAESQSAAAALGDAAEALRGQAAGKSCPVCGSPLDLDRVLARAAAGLGGHAHG